MTKSKIAPRKVAAGATRRWRRASKFCVSVSAFALVLAGSGPQSWQDGIHYLPRAHAAPPSQADDVFADLTPISDEALDNQRGGFKVGNLDISVGVSVSSTIDGFVEVTSNFSIFSPGEIVNVGQIVKSIPKVEIPEVEIPEIPKVEIPKVTIAKGDAASAIVATTAKEIQEVVDASAKLALDTAQAVFDSVEFKEKAKVAQTTVDALPSSAGQSAIATATDPSPAAPSSETSATQTLDQVADQINSGIDAAQKIVSDALPVETALSQNSTSNHQASPSGSVTLTAADASSSGKAASPSSYPSADADVVVSGHDTDTSAATNPAVQVLAAALGDKAEIVHSTENGHLSIIRNSLDGVSIRQSVSVNLTLENFTQVQELTHMQRSLAAIARHVGVYSLRR